MTRLAFFDKAIRILVEGHGTQKVRDTLSVIIVNKAQALRRAKPPVCIFLEVAGVNVTQETGHALVE